MAPKPPRAPRHCPAPGCFSPGTDCPAPRPFWLWGCQGELTCCLRCGRVAQRPSAPHASANCTKRQPGEEPGKRPTLQVPVGVGAAPSSTTEKLGALGLDFSSGECGSTNAHLAEWWGRKDTTCVTLLARSWLRPPPTRKRSLILRGAVYPPPPTCFIFRGRDF